MRTDSDSGQHVGATPQVYGARAPAVFEIDGDLVASRLHEEIGVRRHLDCVRTGRGPVKSARGVRARVCAAGRVC